MLYGFSLKISFVLISFSSIWFMQIAFFLIFIIAVLIGGSIFIGPLSIRVYMTVLMILYLLLNKRPVSEFPVRISSNYIKLFIVFICALGFALIINGGLLEFGFGERCLAYYLVCIVAFFAVDRCVKKESTFYTTLVIISALVFLDAGITILQYQNNVIGWAIGSFFADLDKYSGYLDEHDTFVGVSKLPGIFGHPVTNGFFLAAATPSLLAGIGKKRGIVKTILGISVIIVSLIALLFLQQRAAFFLLVLFIGYHYLREIVSHPVRFLIPLALILLLLNTLVSIDIDSIELGRLASSDNTNRIKVWSEALSVFSYNPLFGSIIEYNRLAEYSAHNVLIDTLVDAGLFGFIPLLCLYFKTVIDAFKVSLHSRDNYARVFSYSVLICMAMGLFHNTSYLTGDVIIFIFLALMLKASTLSHINYSR